MAAGIGIRFFSTGYSQVKGEMDTLDKKAEQLSKTFQKTGSEADSAGPPTSRFFTLFTRGAGLAGSAGMALVSILAKITAAATAVGAAVVAAGVAIGTKMTKSLLMAYDTFEQTRLSMLGILKSEGAVAKLMRFVEVMSTKMPGTTRELFESLRAFAVMPAFEKMFQTGQTAELEKLLRMLAGMKMMTGRPMEYLMMGLRQAFGGGMEGLRSLERYLDIPITEVAKAGGYSIKEIAESTDRLRESLQKYFEMKFPSETLEKLNRVLSTAIENVGDLIERFQRLVAASGVYDTITAKINAAADAMRGFLDTEKARTWAEEISGFIENVFNRISAIFTEGIDWSKIEGLSGLAAAFRKVGENAVGAFTEVWDANKDRIASAMQTVFAGIAEALGWTIGELFIPVGVAIGKGIVKGLAEALTGQMQEAIRKQPYLLGEQEVNLWMRPPAVKAEAAAPAPAKRVMSEEERRSWEAWGNLLTAPARAVEKAPAVAMAAVAKPAWAPGFETEFARESALAKAMLPMVTTLGQLRAEQEKESIARSAAMGMFFTPEMVQSRVQSQIDMMVNPIVERLQRLAEAPGATAEGRTEIFRSLFSLSAQKKDIFGAERFYDQYIKSFEEAMKAQTEAQDRQETLDEDRNEILRQISGKMTVYRSGTEPKEVDVNTFVRE